MIHSIMETFYKEFQRFEFYNFTITTTCVATPDRLNFEKSIKTALANIQNISRCLSYNVP